MAAIFAFIESSWSMRPIVMPMDVLVPVLKNDGLSRVFLISLLFLLCLLASAAGFRLMGFISKIF